MRAVVATLFHDPAWAADEDYVMRRLRSATAPGAWECAAAARFKSPLVEPRSEFGLPDTTPYELITAPTLVVAGAQDELRLPGYAGEIASRIPDSSVHVYDPCGHMPNVEHADRFAEDVLAFLAERYPPGTTTTEQKEPAQ
jgi:pimeloyl-ACP methyl ester carboxylesterase